MLIKCTLHFSAAQKTKVSFCLCSQNQCKQLILVTRPWVTHANFIMGIDAMPELLFKLRNVPDDEAEEIRELLHEHKIGFYETHAGSWGVSMPGIWLRDGLNDDVRLKEAKSLIEAYQRKRTASARTTYDQLKQGGKHQTLFGRIGEQPFRFLMLLFAVLFILYVSLSPFLDFGS